VKLRGEGTRHHWGIRETDKKYLRKEEKKEESNMLPIFPPGIEREAYRKACDGKYLSSYHSAGGGHR